jgi:hypothetical protein
MPTKAELKRQWYQEIPTENAKLKESIWKRLESRGWLTWPFWSLIQRRGSF